MKAVVFPGDRQAEVLEIPEVHPGPGEAVVRLRASGLCGTDLHRYRQPASERIAVARTVYGHEPSGVVETVGEGVRNLRPGDRVSVYHYRGCGQCQYCRAGYIHWCAQRRGGTAAYADCIVTDAVCCLPLPADLSFATGAAIACFLGTAFSAMRKLQVNGEHTLAIFGLGPVGLGGVLVARAMGARVIGVEPIRERRELALQLGAEVIDPLAVDAAQAIRDLLADWALIFPLKPPARRRRTMAPSIACAAAERRSLRGWASTARPWISSKPSTRSWC